MAIFSFLSKLLHGSKSSQEIPERPFIASYSESVQTVGDLQDKPMSAWSNGDIVKCLRFSATLQLRIPLRVLRRHGESHSNPDTAPPPIALNQWEGMWMPQVFNDPYDGEMASDVGPVRANDYLPFLLAIREVIEAHGSIEHRIARLRGMHIENCQKCFLERHGGIEGIIDSFFPAFASTIPSINRETVFELNALGLNTANRLSAATDKTLLAIKGIGPSKLVKIRDYCDGLTTDRDSENLDMVLR